jgi:hypothetical protein
MGFEKYLGIEVNANFDWAYALLNLDSRGQNM